MGETTGLAVVLANLAGADHTLPADRTDPDREWIFPGARAGTTDPMGRYVGVQRVSEDDVRTVYTMVAGHWAAWHSYPKDQWSQAEAKANYDAKYRQYLRAPTSPPGAANDE